MRAEILEKIRAVCPQTREGAVMSSYTTFRIGGAAEVFCEPQSVEEACSLILLLKRESVPYFILGNGSDLLVSDAGIGGCVVRFGKGMKKNTVQGDEITAQSGILLSELASIAAENELSGLEFASGIPGTLGGALYMNAGAYGGEIGSLISSVTYLSADGTVQRVNREDLFFAYRKTSFSENGGIILSCTLKLSRGEKSEIREKMRELAKRRTEKQPLSYPSAGSVFKRPEGYFAGALIEEAGLKGYRIGGAEVSEKHAGFIVNRGGATAEDVFCLIRHIQKTVEERFGVLLETEVKMVGEGFGE